MRQLESRIRRLEPKGEEADLRGATVVWRERGQSEEEALEVRFGPEPRPAKIVFIGWLPCVDGSEELSVPASVMRGIMADIASRGRPRPGAEKAMTAITGVERSEDFGRW